MRQLKFDTPIFKEGTNVTVRRGVQWSLEEVVEIAGAGINRIRTKVMRFCDIGADDLVDEHDVRCRTPEGLLEQMNRLYVDFDPRELVTIVEFDL